jgi:hypothetical protein
MHGATIKVTNSFVLLSDLECSGCFFIHIVENYVTRLESTNNIRSELGPFFK